MLPRPLPRIIFPHRLNNRAFPWGRRGLGGGGDGGWWVFDWGGCGNCVLVFALRKNRLRTGLLGALNAVEVGGSDDNCRSRITAAR